MTFFNTEGKKLTNVFFILAPLKHPSCKKVNNRNRKLKEKAGNGLFIALLLFVGIPVPGTGAWTGTLAASFLDMGFKKSVLAVLGGVLLAGIVMGAASAGLFSALFAVF